MIKYLVMGLLLISNQVWANEVQLKVNTIKQLYREARAKGEEGVIKKYAHPRFRAVIEHYEKHVQNNHPDEKELDCMDTAGYALALASGSSEIQAAKRTEFKVDKAGVVEARLHFDDAYLSRVKFWLQCSQAKCQITDMMVIDPDEKEHELPRASQTIKQGCTKYKLKY